MAGTRNPWEENYGANDGQDTGAKPWEQAYQQPEAPKSRTLGAVANDTVIEVANAAAGGVSAAANFVKPGNAVSGWIDKNIVKAGEDSQSDVTKAAKQQFRDEVENADGVMGELGAVGKYVVQNPLLSAAQAAGSFVGPGLAVKAAGFAGKAAQLGAKGVERAGRAGGVAAGAAMAGGDAAGTAYELSKNAGATEDQAVDAGRQASVIPAIVGGVSGMFGAERLLAGAKGFAGGTASRALKTGASEAAQEGFEEGVTQYEGQRAAMPYDASIDPSKGVAAAAGMGAALGGITGAGTSLLAGRGPQPGGQEPAPDQPPAQPPAPTPGTGPTLALPAPDRGVIQVAGDGTARTPAYQAPGYVGGVTDVEAKTPRAQATDFASILDTDNVYSGWSNVQDGSDRATMRDQMDYVGRTYGGKTTPENAAEVAADLSQQFKWFRAASPEQRQAAISALMAPAAPIDPVREQVAAAAEQGGALSSAALTAIDTGVTQAMQPAPEQATPQISLEEADARDRAAYEQFFAGFDADPVVSRYFENDDDIPDFDAASNASEEDFLRALGATDEDIQDAIATSSQSAIPQSSVASNAGPEAYEPAGPREGAGEGAASQTGQVNAGAIQQAAPDAPVPGVGGTVGADGAGSAAAAVSGASGPGGPGTGAATGSGAGATEAGSARAGGRGDGNQALNAPTNLRDALVRVRQQKQEAANAQDAQAPAPAAAPVPGPAAAPAVEAAGPTPDIKTITAKQIPDMTDGELQQAIAHYGPEHKRTAKLQKEVQRRAGAPSSATTEGTANVPQAAQAQQASPQPTQAAAAPAAAAPGQAGPSAPAGASTVRALTDGAPAANTGAQAAPAAGAQIAAADETREQRAKRVASAGQVWTRMGSIGREALVARAPGLNPIQRKRIPSAAWDDLHADIQRKLADTMDGRAETGANQAPAPTQQTQAATENVANDTPQPQSAPVGDEQRFAPESGTLGIPRAEMPQVPTQSHGGLVKHLNAQGIEHETTMVDAAELKPTQAEFSPSKVEKAKEATGDRAVIVSSDGHIIDGHHQALAAAEEGKPVKAIVLDAPVEQALEAVKASPSAQPATLADAAPAQSPQDFVPAPDGGLDYGEITPEMGKAMRRQAGKIRLRRGDETQGLVHIAERHLDQFKKRGFESVPDFVASVAKSFTAIYKRDGAALDVVLEDGSRGRLVVQLEMAADGDFYDVKTASPIREDQFKNREPLWERAGTSTPTAGESSPPSPWGQNGADSVPPTGTAAQPITRADVAAAQQQTAALIAERIDAMTAQEVQAIARRFLPAMGVAVPAGKARIKTAVTDFTTVNPVAAAAEFGVTLPADVRRALEAEMQGKVADGVVEPAAAPASPQEDIAQAQANAARFEIGKSLTKEQRKQVLDSLVDVYKSKGAEREFKGQDGNGNDHYGYAHSPDLFERSDITGAMVRYYVTLPDGRIAHPTELFPDVSASDIERMVLEQEANSKSEKAFENAIKPFYKDFDSANLMAVAGQVVISKGDRFAIIPDRIGSVNQARQQGWDLAKAAAPVAKPAPAAPTGTTITDFGEKIGGARKDVWSGFRDDLNKVLDDDIAGQPLTKVWPAPDYQKLIDAGMNAKAVAAVRALRDEVPAKPRAAWKVKRWAEQVKTLRGLANDVMDGKITVQDMERMGANKGTSLRGMMGRIELYELVGHEKSLEGVRFAHHHYALYKGRENVSLWVVEKDAGASAFSNWPREIAIGDTKEQALAQFEEKYAGLDLEKAVRKASFDIFSERTSDGFFIGKKIGRNYAKLEGPFKTVKEAREYRQNNLPALETKLEKYKEIPRERADVNQPRVGVDMRNGQNVTPQMFSDVFGFRGVEFGNWVEQKRRQKDLNDAFDALMDMAAVLDIPTKAISLNGKLGLAFGARGSGGVNPAAAHYEPDSVVINLTKKEGAGSLGHEWWHALDNYFAKQRKVNRGSFMTTGTDVGLAARGKDYIYEGGIRQEMIDAFGAVVKAINLTAMKARASKLDSKRTKEYWTTGEEMSARAFESYLISKLQDQNASNDYLANVVSEKTWDAMAALGLENDGSYPYPTAAEIPAIRAGFDHFFQTVETRADDAGNVAMFSRVPPGLTAEEAVAMFNAANPVSPDARNAQRRISDARLVATQQLIDGLKAKWTRAPEIIVARNMQDAQIPQEVRDYDALLKSQGATGEPRGFIYKGKVYLLSDELKGPQQIAEVLFHEVLGHYGLRGAFGDSLNSILQQMGTMRRRDVVAKAREYGLFNKDALGGLDAATASDSQIWAAMSAKNRLSAAEEVLAEMAQTQPTIGFVQRAIAAIRNWLRANVPGFKNLKLTDADIVQAYILPARGYVTRSQETGAQSLERAMRDAGFSRTAGDQTQTEAFKRWYGDWQNTSDVPKQMEPNRDGAQASRNGGAAPIDGIQRQAGVDQDAARADGARRFAFSGASGPTGADGAPVRLYHGTKDDIAAFDLAHPRRKDKGWLGNGVYLTSNLEDANQYARAKRGDAGPNLMPLYANVRNPYEATMAEKARLKGASPKEIAAFTDGLKAKGHDGVVLWDDSGHMELVAFNAADVKSAIGNNGNFDPEDDRINFSRTTEAAKAVGDAIKSVTVTNIKQRAGFKLTDYLGVGLQALGRRQIVDIYGDMLPLGEYNRLVQQMEADKNEGGAEADQLVTRWAKLSDEGKLANLMHDATLAQIDPAKPYVDGDDKARYMTLQGRFNALTDAAKQVYTDTRDSYQAHHAKVRSAIKERIERSEIKGERKAALLKQMDDEFFKAIKGVYFPLARFGQYAVTVKGPDGKVESVSRAETKAEAEALRNNLLSAFPRDKGFTVGRVMLSKDFIADRDAVGRGFMTELYQVLDKQDMDAAQRAELEDTLGQLYLSSLPDLSWAKHGIHRKGTPGFSQDARRAFAQNMFHGARYLAKLRYSDLMQDELAAMQKHVDDWREVEDFDQNSAQRVVTEMYHRHESLMNPKSNKLSTWATSLGFVFHLGLSPASAMVNLSQTALVAYPIMGAKWGFGKASAALLEASKQAAQGRNDITKFLDKDELKAYNEAVRAGTIDVTMAHDLAGIAQGEDAGVMWKIRPVMRYASFLFHHAERFNRQVTFVAAYRLAREAGADHKAAFEQATKATYDGHYDYSAANRPRIMQGNVAKVLLLFKQYGQNMVYTLARNAQQAIKGESPEARSQARKALGGLLATHAAAAGVLGLPMVTTLLAAASMIGGDEDEPWDAKVALQNMLADTFGQKPAEVLAHGLSRLTPWDISGRVGLDKLIFPDVQEGLEGQRLWESAATQALGPVGGIFGGALKGLDLISDGHYKLGLEAMLPAVLRQGVKSIRYATEGAQDKGGVVIKDEVSLAGVAGQLLGFSPSEVRLAQEGKSAIYQQDKALTGRREELLGKAARATRLKDADARAEAMKEIERFNQKNPKLRITPLNVLQSVRNSQRRIDQAEGGVYLPKNRRDAIQAGRFALAESE